MNKLLEMLKTKPGFVSLPGTDDAAIANTETELNLSFSEEYREFLRTFGAVSFEGHELFGLCSSSRLNVVQNTIAEREAGTITASDMYVIEKTGMDGAVICQNTEGYVFLVTENTQPQMLTSNLEAYIRQL